MTDTADPAGFGFERPPSAESTGPETARATATATVRRLPGIGVAAAASIGAGAVHAAAIGIRAEHVGLARLFVLTSVLQLGAGLVALARPRRVVAAAVVAINAGAVAGWLTTRLTGISFIGGLEEREAAQFADSATAGLGLVAATAALAALLVGWQVARPMRLFAPALVVAMLVVPAMTTAGTHVHSNGDPGEAAHDHGTGAEAPPGDGAGEGAAAPTESTTSEHTNDHTGDDHTGDDHTGDDPADSRDDSTRAAPWPRPWDPAAGIDISGVDGVSIEQELRAIDLIEGSLLHLPKYADPAAAVADGYASIGDAGTGSEHYLKQSLIEDDVFLDPTQPESLVYTAVGETRTLAGAMYIAGSRAIDDPSLLEFAGPLMEWHIHDNLCWALDASGKPQVVGIIDGNGNCARGVRAGGENPMVHVWIMPHPCGVFAALEGIGAGSAAVSEAERVDMCHDDQHGGEAPTVSPVPYDPTKPIDLGGVDGVTPEQQAAAENLVAINVVRLPQWSDFRVAEEAGFRSIGDGLTGHEHFINWDWIDDDVVLDPDHPESLVYEIQADGSKKLVSAMYMLAPHVALDAAPDIGGALMQWHIHDNLCFTPDPNAPKVGGLVNGQGECRPPLTKFAPAAMIHVWITPHPCGPFAALEGVAAGQIAEGETRLCDEAHGSH